MAPVSILQNGLVSPFARLGTTVNVTEWSSTILKKKKKSVPEMNDLGPIAFGIILILKYVLF